MPITSYAQNFEDVILWRALEHVERGFYIDIGAQDPVVDSVSLAFYERGWRGIHVEPSANYAEKLRAARPDEEVFQVAVALQDGEIAFFEIPNTGMSTGDEEIARKHESDGFKVRSVSVASQPLSAILSRHGDRDIHWMKIDVEGMERQVMKSWLPATARPWVVVVESTKPNSQEQNHDNWESELLDLGYWFVYFDGLNRFYLSHSHAELMSKFGVGPNYFDAFVASNTSWLCRNANVEIDVLRQQLTEERNDRAALEVRLAEEQNAKSSLEVQQRGAESALESERHARQALEGRLATIYASTSWRITEPLRFSMRAVRWLAGR